MVLVEINESKVFFLSLDFLSIPILKLSQSGNVWHKIKDIFGPEFSKEGCLKIFFPHYSSLSLFLS